MEACQTDRIEGNEPVYPQDTYFISGSDERRLGSVDVRIENGSKRNAETTSFTTVEHSLMPSSAFRLSIRSLLLVIVFQLGFCILLLADVANTTRGYGTLLTLSSGLAGGVTVVGALLGLMSLALNSDSDDSLD